MLIAVVTLGQLPVGPSVGAAAAVPILRSPMAVVCRAPLAKIQRFQARLELARGSSHGSDSNYDVHVTLDEARGYSYRNESEFEAAGFRNFKSELHGTSVFLREGLRGGWR